MPLVQVKFVFPFKLSLPSKGFWVTYKGRPYNVCTFNIDGLRNYIYTEQQEGQEFSKEKGTRYLANIRLTDGEERSCRESFFIDEDPYVFLRKVIDIEVPQLKKT